MQEGWREVRPRAGTPERKPADGLGGRWRVLRVSRKTRMTPRVLTVTGRKVLLKVGGEFEMQVRHQAARGVLEGGAGE